MSNPALRASEGLPHSETSTASGKRSSRNSRTLRQSCEVQTWPGSSLTRLAAISTRKPSQPRPSQKAMMSCMSRRVASASGESAANCQSSVTVPKP